MDETLHERWDSSVHSSYEIIDQALPVSMITTLNEVPSLLPKPSTSTAELEWPQEVIGLLEMGTNGVDMVNQVLHADHSLLPQRLKEIMQTIHNENTINLLWATLGIMGVHTSVLPEPCPAISRICNQLTFSIMEFSVSGVRLLSTFPYPLLYISSRTVFKLG